MKKVVFSTHVSDDWFDLVGAAKLIASARHFHPDVPFVVFRSREIEAAFAADPTVGWDTLIPALCRPLAWEYELVVHLDADSCIVATMDELMFVDFEIAGVRNNNDYGKAGAGPGMTIGNIPIAEYVNCGLIAATRPDFWVEWQVRNRTEAVGYADREQAVYNLIFHGGRYQTKILDPKGSNVYYGVANTYGTHSNWDSWAQVKVIGNGLFLDGRRIKVLHQAGGHFLPKLDFRKYFAADVCQFLKEITREGAYGAAPSLLLRGLGH
jgi:hypothetical protein